MGTVWLIKAEPYDPASSGAVEVLWSLGSKTPKFDGKHWPAVLIEPPQISARLFDRDNLLSGGSFKASAPLRIAIGEGDDDWRTYNWEGRDITIYRGEEGDAFGSFTTLVTTTIQSVRWTRRIFELRLGNFLERLRQPVALSRYAGTGADEGGADLKNKPKPRALGKPQAVEPTLIDERAGIYQVNDGEVGGIDNVYVSAKKQSLDLFTSPSGGDITNLRVFARARNYAPFPLDGLIIDGGQITFGGGDFNSDGLNYFVPAAIDVGGTVSWFVLQYALTRAFDFSSDARIIASVPADDFMDAGGVEISSVALSENGRVLFVLDTGTIGVAGGLGYLYQLDLSQVDNIISWSYTSGDFLDVDTLLTANVRTRSTIRSGKDGSSLYVEAVQTGSIKIFEISLSTANDITTASFTSGDVLTVSSSMEGFDISSDGSYLFASYNTVFDNGFQRWDMSTAWDITTASKDHEAQFFNSQALGLESVTVNLVENASGDVEGIFVAGGSQFTYLIERGLVLRLPTLNSVSGLTDTLLPDYYVTDEADGLLMVNPAIDGVVHVDLSTSGGDLDTSILNETPGALIQQLLLQELETADLDSASFTQIETDINDSIGYYISSNAFPSIAETCVDIASSVGAAIRPNKDGKLGIVQVKLGTSVATINESDIIQGSFRRIEPPDRVWKARVGYGYNWRALNDSEINFAEAVEADINRLRIEQRQESSETSSILVEDLTARERSYVGYYAAEADAATEAARRVTLLGEKRDVYRFRLKGHQFTRQVGETITLVHPDTRDSTGLDCIVVGVEERRDGETELEVWG